MDDRPKIVHFTFVKLTGFDIWRENMTLWREDKSIFCKKSQMQISIVQKFNLTLCVDTKGSLLHNGSDPRDEDTG
jgi:hypothetical protein